MRKNIHWELAWLRTIPVCSAVCISLHCEGFDAADGRIAIRKIGVLPLTGDTNEFILRKVISNWVELNEGCQEDGITVAEVVNINDPVVLVLLS